MGGDEKGDSHSDYTILAFGAETTCCFSIGTTDGQNHGSMGEPDSSDIKSKLYRAEKSRTVQLRMSPEGDASYDHGRALRAKENTYEGWAPPEKGPQTRPAQTM